MSKLFRCWACLTDMMLKHCGLTRQTQWLWTAQLLCRRRVIQSQNHVVYVVMNIAVVETWTYSPDSNNAMYAGLVDLVEETPAVETITPTLPSACHWTCYNWCCLLSVVSLSHFCRLCFSRFADSVCVVAFPIFIYSSHAWSTAQLIWSPYLLNFKLTLLDRRQKWV